MLDVWGLTDAGRKAFNKISQGAVVYYIVEYDFLPKLKKIVVKDKYEDEWNYCTLVSEKGKRATISNPETNIFFTEKSAKSAYKKRIEQAIRKSENEIKRLIANIEKLNQAKDKLK